MIVTCISDLHGHYPKLDGGDLLIVAGDMTSWDDFLGWQSFSTWLCAQKYTKKIFIAGNHDNYLFESRLMIMPLVGPQNLEGVEFLCDSGTEFESLKIWGSPWTKTFKGMNPHCKAFTCNTEEELDEYFKLIPSDVDILITHSPPFSILDMTDSGYQVGSCSLMAHHLNRLRPKLWVWGHIHEAYGRAGPYQWNKTLYVNASHVNERYQPVNAPITLQL